jgi:hypothetical protein
MRFKFRPVLLGSACALVLSGAFVTVAHAAAPTVSGLSAAPGGTWTTEGGQQLTITGTGFTGATSIQFGLNTTQTVVLNTDACPTGTGSGGCFTVTDDSHINVIQTPGHPQTALPADVTVTTAMGTSATSSADQMTFVASPPKAASLSVHSGPPGAAITIGPADGLQELSAYDFATRVDFIPASGPTVSVTTAPCTAGAADCFTLNADLVKLVAPTSGFTFGTVYDVVVHTAGGTSPPNASTDQFTFAAPHFSPQSVGAPSVALDPSGTQLIFWQGAGGHLFEAWWNGFWNGPVDWTAANGWAPSLASAPTVALAPSGTQIIFWQGTGGHLFEAWWNGSWNGPVDWTAANHWSPSVTSAPSVAFSGSTQLVFWQGTGGHLLEAWWNGSWNGPVDWTTANHWSPSVNSGPSVAIDPSGTQLIFWKGAGGHLDEVWWNGSWNGPVDWTVANHWSPTMTSAPSVAFSGSTQLIFWQGTGGHLFEAWWNGSWNGPVDWTSAKGWAPSLTSAPSVAIQSNATQLIFWQGTGSHLFEVWWNGAWNGPVDWSS